MRAALVAVAAVGWVGAAAPGSQTVSQTGSQTVSQAVPQTVSQTVPGTVRGTGDSDSADSGSGRAAYAKACEACHGPDGQGGTAPALVPFTLELSELIAIVRQGIGVMPGIPRDRISDEEISAIRDYLVSRKN